MNLRGLQFLTLFFVGSLFALTGLRQFFVEPLASTSSNLIWFGIQVLPLLLVLPGVLRLAPRSYLLAILASMLYFCHGVLQAVSVEDRVLGLWEVGFSLALVHQCVARLGVSDDVYMATARGTGYRPRMPSALTAQPVSGALGAVVDGVDLRSIEVDEGKLAGKMLITFVDDSSIDFDIVKTSGPGPFADKFTELTGR